jgi:hypothetical protein
MNEIRANDTLKDLTEIGVGDITEEWLELPEEIMTVLRQAWILNQCDWHLSLRTSQKEPVRVLQQNHFLLPRLT